MTAGDVKNHFSRKESVFFTVGGPAPRVQVAACRSTSVRGFLTLPALTNTTAANTTPHHFLPSLHPTNREGANFIFRHHGVFIVCGALDRRHRSAPSPRPHHAHGTCLAAILLDY